jgi:hypothetical protein
VGGEDARNFARSAEDKREHAWFTGNASVDGVALIAEAPSAAVGSPAVVAAHATAQAIIATKPAQATKHRTVLLLPPPAARSGNLFRPHGNRGSTIFANVKAVGQGSVVPSPVTVTSTLDESETPSAITHDPVLSTACLA